MPLPALPILAALWAAKTGGAYIGYKQLKKHRPDLVEEWEGKARRLKDQATGFILGKEDPAGSGTSFVSDTKDDNKPPEL